MGRLDEKIVIITGAARGMGEEEAHLFAREGARVVLGDRRDDEGREVASRINEKHPNSAIYVHLDITSEDDWDRAVAAAVEHFEGVDVLINNAGIIRIAPLVETSAEMFRKVIDTNLFGAFLGMKAVVEPMKKRGGGSIVNLSSVQGLEGRVGMPAYTASKFGVRGLTKTAAMELGPLGIRVNTLIPGPTKTAMTRRKGWTDADYDAAYGKYPLGRMADAKELAELALFLASDASSFCTGADFVADGGVSAGKPRD
ncbi:glucose 1-dehydrogenase [Myxococcota bacterium]|nr:glucose 1-dehydrogenase [Myxococcota bacterium]